MIATATSIETQIRDAYQALASKPGDWVSLTRLREQIGDVNRHEVDKVLVRMSTMPDVNIVPESNQKTLTWIDRQCAVEIGNQQNHLIAIW